VRRLTPALKWAFSAHTHKATRVLKAMAEKYNIEVDCFTTASLLGLKLSNDGEVRRVEATGRCKAQLYDVMVVDEGSQINEEYEQEIDHCAHAMNIKVIYMGDPTQTPPVGETRSKVFDTPNKSYLRQVVRQAEGSPILAVSAHLRECIANETLPDIRTTKNALGGVYVMPHDTWLHWIKSAYNSEGYQQKENLFKIVSWRNKVVDRLNRSVRSVMYPDCYLTRPFVEGERVTAVSTVYFKDPEDPLMATDEDAVIRTIEVAPHPIYGELFKVYILTLEREDGALIQAAVIHPDSERDYSSELNSRSSEARADRSLWPAFWNFKSLFAEVRPCHAITVHRSQGSTYQNVFVHAGDILTNRNLKEALQCLNVAVGRASKNVMLTFGGKDYELIQRRIEQSRRDCDGQAVPAAHG
jgi:hypothetical protein